MRTIILLRTFEVFQSDQIYGTRVRGYINKQLVKCTYNGVKRYQRWLLVQRDLGGFQLLDLIIPELKSHVIPYKLEYSHWWKIYLSKKNPLQDLLSSLNAVISTNERS